MMSFPNAFVQDEPIVLNRTVKEEKKEEWKSEDCKEKAEIKWDKKDTK